MPPKRYLSGLTKEELITEIMALIQRFPEVKQFYELKLSPHREQEIVNEFKKRIQQEFFPSRGLGQARLRVAQKPIQEFRKIEPSPSSLADLMLWYVELGVRYTNTYGDLYEAFYASMETMLEKTLRLMSEHSLKDDFHDRIKNLVVSTRYIGWGFNDTFESLFKEYSGHSA